jgi:hypothetical protein
MKNEIMKAMLEDPRYKALKKNLKARSKGELIQLLFEVHTYLDYYKNEYLKLKDVKDEKSTESVTTNS